MLFSTDTCSSGLIVCDYCMQVPEQLSIKGASVVFVL